MPAAIGNIPSSSAAIERVEGLDALRGWAILAMALSGLVPRSTLPNWMYHAQVPPPNHVFDPTIAGITWVDLVFPFFLFSMGVSIPIALARRLKRGAGTLSVIIHVATRGCLLGFFAIYIQHIKPYVLKESPTMATWGLAQLGFALMFPVFTRLPLAMHRKWRIALRVVGWVALGAFLLSLRYSGDAQSGFAKERSDIIIVVLANVSVSGSLVWLLTRGKHAFRLLIMVGLLGMRLAHASDGWVSTVWNWSPIPWMYTFYYHQYLLIVLPGTIVGDLLLSRSGEQAVESQIHVHRFPWKVVSLTAICLALTVWVCMGLQARWLLATPLIVVATCVITYCAWPTRDDDPLSFMKPLFAWGVGWLLIGLIFEPYEGGIKKDHPTISYYFVTAGLAIMVLVAFTILIDRLELNTLFAPLIKIGQNPMIAYAGISNLLAPAMGLLSADVVMRQLVDSPWLGFAAACVQTLLLALAVDWFTRRRIVWRT